MVTKTYWLYQELGSGQRAGWKCHNQPKILISFFFSFFFLVFLGDLVTESAVRQWHIFWFQGLQSNTDFSHLNEMPIESVPSEDL